MSQKELVIHRYDSSGPVIVRCQIEFFDKKTGRLVHGEVLKCSYAEFSALVKKHFGCKEGKDFRYIHDLTFEQFQDFQPYLDYQPNPGQVNIQIGLYRDIEPKR